VAVDLDDIRIGTAGWSMPPQPRVDQLQRRVSALARYARLFGASEVNSSFHRHHRPTTWTRWAQTVPEDFRFSIKLPRAITHDARLDLAASMPVLERLLDELAGLGAAMGPMLVQLPPSLAFDPKLADRFWTALRERWAGGVACEPRHATWFEAAADELLVHHRVARVAADPAVVPAAADPGGWDGLAYVRLHGSPRIYWSAYDDAYLAQLEARLRLLADGPAREVWCIFDNTASGAAFDDARRLTRRLTGSGSSEPDAASVGRSR
jgi:uncharacterized protein YecE (DUF72 family)